MSRKLKNKLICKASYVAFTASLAGIYMLAGMEPMTAIQWAIGTVFVKSSI